jgi:hypothetical protein
LYNALATKNPRPDLNRFTTSAPLCFSIGTLVSYNRFIYGFNASYKTVDIQQTFGTNTEIGYNSWENSDFDFNIGYKLIKTQKISLHGLIGLGIQRRLEYNMKGILPVIVPQPDSSVITTFFKNEIKPKNKTPLYLNIKLESEFDLGNRFSLFFCVESNVFFQKNYYLRNTWVSSWNGGTYIENFDGQHFTNNSISSTLGFRYTIQKSKKIETPFER